MLEWLLVKGFGFVGWWLMCNKGDLKGLGLGYFGCWAGNFILRDCKEVGDGENWELGTTPPAPLL
jgi:hypothetical protein